MLAWPLVGAIGHAQQFVWAAWETTAVPKRGPQSANALLVYFHGRGDIAVGKEPIPDFFVDMARRADWDILRINRLPYVDRDSEDDHLLAFIAQQIDHARRDGYRQIFVGGGSRGGWLSLLSATLDNVDGAVALAPGTTGRPRLEWQRDALAERLSVAKARRIAVFFFEGDPLEEVERGPATRRALRSSGTSFMVVDHPADLSGHGAAAQGRFTRRYRDCVLQFLRAAEMPRGEISCDTGSGYAVGAEIGFPASARLPDLAAPANPAFRPYIGRWQGDSPTGAYMIMEAVEVRADGIVFSIGRSPMPLSAERPRHGNLTFQVDEAGQRLVCVASCGAHPLQVRLMSPTELQFDQLDGLAERRRVFLLRKQPVVPTSDR